MTLARRTRFAAAALTAVAVSGCTTTTPAAFQKNPRSVPKVTLCRTYLESHEPVFQQQILAELASRGISAYDCPTMVQQQNQAATALVAVAVVGGAVAYCANHNCGGGSYYRPAATYQGNCRYDWQYDAAGNKCGHRSAQSRPGGW